LIEEEKGADEPNEDQRRNGANAPEHDPTALTNRQAVSTVLAKAVVVDTENDQKYEGRDELEDDAGEHDVAA
jgi:hypothetical protein